MSAVKQCGAGILGEVSDDGLEATYTDCQRSIVWRVVPFQGGVLEVCDEHLAGGVRIAADGLGAAAVVLRLLP